MRRVEGDPLDCLLDVLDQERATLAVVGTHETDRLAGILLGSVAPHLLHKAPCSVLIVRRGWPDGGPRRVLVGVDGSPQSEAALTAARELSARLGGELETVSAHAPVRALVTSAGPEDLIVVAC